MALDKIRIFESFIGTVVGAAVALGSFWFQSEYKERQSIQSWFEEEYIAKAIDPASTFVSILKLHLQRPEIEFAIKDNFPLTPLTRIETLTGSSTFTDALTEAVLLSKTFRHLKKAQRKGVLAEIDRIKAGLADLRKWALDKHISDKSDIYKARLEMQVKNLDEQMEMIVRSLSSG